MRGPVARECAAGNWALASSSASSGEYQGQEQGGGNEHNREHPVVQCPLSGTVSCCRIADCPWSADSWTGAIRWVRPERTFIRACPDHSCGDAHGYRSGWDVMRDDGSRTDDGAISDPDSIQDNDPEAQPDVIAYDYVPFRDKRLAIDGFIRPDAVIVWVERAPGSDMHIFPN